MMAVMDTGDFFDLVWGDEEGWVTFATFPGGFYSPKAPLNQDVWFSWPDQRDDVIATARTHGDKDLYFCPVVFAEKRSIQTENGRRVVKGGRRADNAKSLRVAYADADGCPPRKFRLEPTITVESSPGRHHTYWLLQDHTDVAEAVQLSKRIAYAHADDGCDLGGWDITQLFRVPGSSNNKTGTPASVAATSSGVVHTLDDLNKAYPQAELDDVTPNADAPELPKDLPTYAQALEEVSDNETINQMLQVQGRAPTPEREGNRSELMWALLCRLAEHGVSRAVAYTLSWDVAYNKTRLKGRTKAEFWGEVCKAYDHLGIPEIDAADDDDQEEEQRPAIGEPPIRLLTETERETAPVTIVDRYANWARTTTDADRGYQEAAMMTVLAAVFGEYGKPATKFDSGYLNVWFMVLGGTTRSRKSTVRRGMLRLLAHVGDGTYNYDLGSNATAEGLHNELLERGSQGAVSSVFQRDEVQGLLDEQNRKMYMAGLQELMTELYDGGVPGKLRSGGAVQGTETVFHMYMTGIETAVTEAFTLDDFKSGHLARFLFVQATPPPSSRESVRIEQAEESEIKGVDPKYLRLIEEIKEAKRYWVNVRQVQRGRQRKVLWEPDAWERLNEIRYKAVIWSERHRFKEVMEATVQRSLNALLKVSTLLAMVERSDKVQMHHLIRATVFLEQRLADMETVMNGVDASGRGKLMESIHADVESTGSKGVTFKRLYSLYKGKMSAGQLKALLRDLREAGDIQWDGTKAKGTGS